MKILPPLSSQWLALVYGGRLGTARVRARIRFGQAKRADFFALAERDQVFLLLLFIAESEDRPGAKRNMGGQDYAGAIEMARDAIGLMGIDMEDDGETLPQPSPMAAVSKEREDDIVTPG